MSSELKAICAIPNCLAHAPAAEAFCAKHREPASKPDASPGDEGGKSPTYDRASIADLTARLAKAEEALRPFANYYELNDCADRHGCDALEVPVYDLRVAYETLALKPTGEA